MADLLVINPNTTASITELLRRHVSGELALAAPKTSIGVHVVTARFGAPYISSESGYAIAAHSAMDAWAAWQVANRSSAEPAQLGAILIGCFGDPGLLALRESAGVPVTGLAEASFIEASKHGRFAIVTGGERWKPMLQRLAWSLGFDSQLAGIHTVTPDGAQLAADPEGAIRLLAEACRDAAAATGADAIILGGAGLAGMAAQMASLVPVPLIDSVAAGARQAASLASAAGRSPASAGFDTPWSGLSAEMTALGIDKR